MRWRMIFRLALTITWWASLNPGAAEALSLGGSVRGYQFLRVGESLLEDRRDTELWNLRLTWLAPSHPRIKGEWHGILDLQSPSLSGASRLATSVPQPYLPLQQELIDRSDLRLEGRLDRFNLQMNSPSLRIVIGRHAISWGVTFFWPSMDLFSPFNPQQIDRDYKSGVDAIRITIPLGPYSEFELIGAVLGSSISEDGTVGSMTRIYLGSIDIGLMGGRFHRDTVLGGFLTGDVKGTGIRGEATWTRSGDPEDRIRDRKTFWRGSVGLDRQITPEMVLTLESSWNGHGTDDPSEYPAMIESDRIRRGEVNALGRFYIGASASYQIHPLWKANSALLVNWNDPSSLWVLSNHWSTSDNSEILFGVQVGLGEGLTAGGIPGSEYGSAADTLYIAYKAYF